MYYVITCLSTRRSEDERPTLHSDGYNENIQSDLLGVFTNKEQAVNNVKEIAKHFEENWKESVTTRINQKGNIVTAEVYSSTTDLSGNEWITQVFLKTIKVINENINTSDLYFQL